MPDDVEHLTLSESEARQLTGEPHPLVVVSQVVKVVAVVPAADLEEAREGTLRAWLRRGVRSPRDLRSDAEPQFGEPGCSRSQNGGYADRAGHAGGQ
jgi:hypothetical protein